MLFVAFLLGFVTILVKGERQSAMFNIANITCSKILDQSELPRDLLQCSILCLDESECEAFNYENGVCSLHSELLCCQETQEKWEVFVHEKLTLKKLKAKQTSRCK